MTRLTLSKSAPDPLSLCNCQSGCTFFSGANTFIKNDQQIDASYKEHERLLGINAAPHSCILHEMAIFLSCQFILPLLDSFQLCDSEEIKHQNSSSNISSAWQCNFFCLKAVSSTEIIACLLLTGAIWHQWFNSCLYKACTKTNMLTMVLFSVQGSSVFHIQDSDSSWTEL